MIDFDDMDDAAAARLEEDGEDEAALQGLGAVEAPAEWEAGRPLPQMRASDPAKTWLPSRLDMTAYCEAHGVRAGGLFKENDGETSPKVRLFIFYGAGDSIAAWANFVNALPAWLDVAIFEVAAHGFRKSEEQQASMIEVAKDAFKSVSEVLEDHAHGGFLEGAPFALAGHSLGCQIMIEVAAMAKRRLGLEPVALFPIDRGAPHMKLYTDEGYRLLCLDEPQEFFDGFNPMIGKMMQDPARQKPGTDHERQIRMWQRDLQNCQEHVWEQGDHIFRCPIHVFAAEENFMFDEAAKIGALKSQPADIRRMHELNCKITNAGPKSSAPWSVESYQAWDQWTTQACKVHSIQAGHVNVKTHPDTVKGIIKALSDALGL